MKKVWHDAKAFLVEDIFVIQDVRKNRESEQWIKIIESPSYRTHKMI